MIKLTMIAITIGKIFNNYNDTKINNNTNINNNNNNNTTNNNNKMNNSNNKII